MRFLFLFLAIKLFAFNIVLVDKNIALIDENITKGVSGIIICPYQKQDIIAANFISLGDRIKLLPYKNLKNEALALPIVPVNSECKVIPKKNYERILILAPTQKEYLKLKKRYSNNIIIPSDTFAIFYEDELSKEDILNFANTLDIGRIIVVYGNVFEVDAKSLEVIKKISSSYKKENKFFTNYKNFDINYSKLIKGIDG